MRSKEFFINSVCKESERKYNNGTLFLIKFFEVIILEFYYSLFFLKNK